MRRLQTVIAGLGLLYLALLIGTNLGCAPKYFLRADVLAGLAVTVCALGLLALAVGGDGGHVLPDVGTFLLSPDQFRCP
ncbi:MAG: hypothetical protein E6J09_10410 [Chloroflexi bacterium]|nr:MAG: hypothetical protein E6J09_10395 [Chloroflexota bacterium]TMC76214.1 MAG: hypothetical protein E6J09_10410 [Chloroflexota bacterium]